MVKIQNNKKNAVFDKEKHTLLIPSLFPVHMDFLADAIRSSGYRVEVLQYDNKEVFDVALKYINNDMCYPAICSVGQLLYAVESGNYDLNKIALMQFQTGGGCRASNYTSVLQKALKKMNLNHIPVVNIGFNSLKGSDGFEINLTMIFKLLLALSYGDVLMLLKNQVLPYEVNKGDTEKTVKKWHEKIRLDIFYSHVSMQFSKTNMHGFKKNLRKMVEDFGSIVTDKATKTKVGIVGEVYVKYSALGNNNLEKFLSEQNCEYMMPGVLGFVHYCLDNSVTDYKLYGGKAVKTLVNRFFCSMINRYEKCISGIIRKKSKFAVPFCFKKMKKLSGRAIGSGVKMGEGWYLAAEIMELTEKGYENVICIQPFGCLPNHIVGKGVIRKIKEIYPTLNICSIDYDYGTAAVNQENRIKLMLQIAENKSRC